MDSRTSESGPNARDVVLGSSSPEQRLVMAMLAAPGAGHIWGEPAAIAASTSWERFLSVADEVLQPYLHWVSEQALFGSHIPPSAVKTLAAERFTTGVVNLRWKAELRQIIEAFRAERISLMMVKGAALQRTVYPDPSTRPMADVDLVVRRDEMAQVTAVLCRLGFLHRASPENFTPWAGLNADEEDNFYKEVGNQILFVEIHTRLEMKIPAYSGSPQTLWTHRVDVESTDGIPVSTLEPHAALRHLCLHLSKHGFERGLRWLLDIRLFVEYHKPSIRWDQFIQDCDRQTLPMIAFTLSLAADWLGADIPASIGAALPPENKRRAVSLVWDQMWDYESMRKPPNVLTAVLSGSPRRFWTYLRIRFARWTTPIPGRNGNPFVLVGKRLWSDFGIFGAAFRLGGFRLSSMRAARRSDRRFSQIRKLFRLPLEH